MVGKTVQQAQFLEPIQDLLNVVDKIMGIQATDRHPDLAQAIDHLLSSGGKRIRPAVAILIGQIFDAPVDKLVTLAAAIELLHTATLVHDDLIDGALFRRGNATINSQWTPAATVLTGDYIFARAANLAAETGSVSVMQLFAETLAVIVNGEIAQLFDKKGIPSVIDYEKRIYAKTASMFELAVVAAAMLSPVDKSFVDEIHSFGRNLGMAFQIVDDILDFTGEATSVGKPVGSDLRQGIITLPVILYLEQKPDPRVEELITNYWLDDDNDFQDVINAIRESDKIDQAYRIAMNYIDQTLGMFNCFPDNQYKDAMRELVDFTIQRRL